MRGFTLIELLVSITIIGILAAIGIPLYFNQIERAKEVEVILLLDSMATPIKEYRVVNNAYPDDVVSNVTPELSEWPTEVPFDSILDYDHWGIGNGRCVVIVAHFGKNKLRDSPVHVRVGAVGSIKKVGDDYVKTIAEYPCDNPVGSIR